MTSRRAVIPAALVVGAGVARLVAASDHRDAAIVWAIFLPVVGWCFVGTGLYASERRPESRTGTLMILLGFAWFLQALAEADSSLTYTIGIIAEGSGAGSSCTSA